jgi:DNA/RNA endonuclease YhcR with UshA esterase domain
MTLRRLVAFFCAICGMLLCQLHALAPEEAARYIGKQGAVDGVAVQVSQARGNVFVNFGAEYPDHVFTAFVARGDLRLVGWEYLKSLEGRPVSVAGRITKVKGKPQIQITKKDQIILVVQPGGR